MVREQLADELELGQVGAVGAWDFDRLAGLSVWRVQDNGAIWRSILVARQLRYYKRGVGRRLKEHLIQQAREAGARWVTSSVDWDNGPMLELNQALGASIVPDPEEPVYHRLCTISLI